MTVNSDGRGAVQRSAEEAVNCWVIEVCYAYETESGQTTQYPDIAKHNYTITFMCYYLLLQRYNELMSSYNCL